MTDSLVQGLLGRHARLRDEAFEVLLLGGQQREPDQELVLFQGRVPELSLSVS